MASDMTAESTTFDHAPPAAAYLLPLVIGFVVFAWPTLSGLSRVYRTDGNFSHGFLVPLISAYAAWQMRDRLRPGFAPNHAWGLVLLVGGSGIILFSRWYELALMPRGVIAMAMAAVGLVFVVGGVAWLTLGWPQVRKAVFPVAFLLLAVPIPSFLLNQITLPMQRIAATLSAYALRLVGIAVKRQGNVLQFFDGALGVDEACSGIRSLAVLIAVVFAIIHFQRVKRLQAAILVAAIIPAAIFGNMIRVFVSGVFYAIGWKQLAHGGPHEFLGLITFAIAVGLILGLNSLISSEDVAESSGPAADSDRSTAAQYDAPPSNHNALANGVFAAAFLLFASAGASFYVGHHYDRLYAETLTELEGRRSLDDFPTRLGPYVRRATGDLSEGEFRMLDPSESMIATYVGPSGRNYELTILYWDPPEGRPSERNDLLKRPHSPDWCFPAAGWDRLHEFDQSRHFDMFPSEVGHVRLYEREGRQQVVLFWTGIASARTASPDQIVSRIRDMALSWHSPPLANLHMVSIGVNAMGEPAFAKDAAMEFARVVADELPAYGIGLTPEKAQ